MWRDTSMGTASCSWNRRSGDKRRAWRDRKDERDRRPKPKRTGEEPRYSKHFQYPDNEEEDA